MQAYNTKKYGTYQPLQRSRGKDNDNTVLARPRLILTVGGSLWAKLGRFLKSDVIRDLLSIVTYEEPKGSQSDQARITSILAQTAMRMGS